MCYWRFGGSGKDHPAGEARGDPVQLDFDRRLKLDFDALSAARLQAFGVTEPSSGTRTSRIRTSAVRHGDGWLVNGQKVWTSRVELLGPCHPLLAATTPREEVEERMMACRSF